MLASVSLARTSITMGLSSSVVAVSSAATGSTFTTGATGAVPDIRSLSVSSSSSSRTLPRRPKLCWEIRSRVRSWLSCDSTNDVCSRSCPKKRISASNGPPPSKSGLEETLLPVAARPGSNPSVTTLKDSRCRSATSSLFLGARSISKRRSPFSISVTVMVATTPSSRIVKLSERMMSPVYAVTRQSAAAARRLAPKSYLL